MPHPLIIFDLDGTLVDSYAAIQDSLAHAMTALGFAPWSEEETKARVGRGLEVLMKEAVGEAHVTEGVRLFRTRYPQIFLQKSFLLPGVEETVAALHASSKCLAVATNKPSDFSRDLLAHLGLGHLFSLVMGPMDVPRPKPHPDMIHAILERLKYSPDMALYVGDMTLDAESAANAGVDCVLVASGGNSPGELRSTGHPVLENIRQLIALEVNHDQPSL
jgi:phosphoglycolate phosphatase